MSGQLRKGFHDLLIKLHLESFVNTRSLAKYEFVVPLSKKLTNNQLANHEQLMKHGNFPCKDDFVSVQPEMIKENEIKVEEQRLYLVPPKFNLENLKHFILNSFCDSVKLCAAHARDPTGGTNSYLFV